MEGHPSSISLQDVKISANDHLKRQLYNTLKWGVNTPNEEFQDPYGSLVEPSSNDEYVFKYLIHEFDGISYKLQLFCHADQSVIQSIVKKHKEKEFFKSSNSKRRNHINKDECITHPFLPSWENSLKLIRSSAATNKHSAASSKVSKSVLLYISHPFFEQLWNEGAIDIFTNSFGCEEESTQHKVSVNEIQKEWEGYDLEIEMHRHPMDDTHWQWVSSQCGSIRAYLNCGPIQQYFKRLQTTSIEPNIQQIQIREDEMIWLTADTSHVTVVLSINYRNENDAAFIRRYCEKLRSGQCKLVMTALDSVQYDALHPSPEILQFIAKSGKELEPPNVGYLSFKIQMEIFDKSNPQRWQTIEEDFGYFISGLRPFFDKISLHNRVVARQLRRGSIPTCEMK